MTRSILAVAAIAALIASSPAQARHHHSRHYSGHRTNHRTVDRLPAVASGCVFSNEGRVTCAGQEYRTSVAPRANRRAGSYSDARVIGGRPFGCPHAYCGCSASLHVFGRIIPELNLASNWGRKFSPASPAPGMAAYRNHHVFIIESVNGDGTVVAHDGNSGGGLTRLHTVSLAGYRVVDPHSSRYASR